MVVVVVVEEEEEEMEINNTVKVVVRNPFSFLKQYLPLTAVGCYKKW